MRTDLAQSLLRAIERHHMCRAGDRIAVAVSGGADSVALLLLLDKVRASLGIGIAVLHFNHLLRGADSDADEKFVAELAAQRGIDFFAGRADVAAEARARGWNLEDAARRLRYEFFSSAVSAGRATHVGVAHTADDQAETVLARLVRGTGPAGLAAIYPVKGHVVRPLLDVRRSELRKYLEDLGQPWREDASNLDTTRLRAKLRHDLLPLIERDLQPNVVTHLCRLGQMSREDEAFWAAFAAERLAAFVCREKGSGEAARLGIRCADLLAPLPGLGATQDGTAQMALTKRLVRRIVDELRGERSQLSAQHVDQVVRLATESSSGHRTELPGVTAERNFEWIWFEIAEDEPKVPLGTASGHQSSPNLSRVAQKEFSYAVELGIPGETATVAIPEIGRCFKLKVIDWSASERDTNVQGFLDRDSLQSPLLLRSWHPGDRFRPQGRRNVRKLKQLLRASRIRLRDRAGWPVLTSAGSLAWSRGFPVAADFAPQKATRAGVVITEEHI